MKTKIKNKTAYMIVFWTLCIFVSIWACFYAQAETYDQIMILEQADLTWTAPKLVDTRTTKEHVWDLLIEGGLSFDEAIEGMAIVSCESKWDQYAVNFKSKDFGLWQINERYHPKVGRECSFDVYCSTRYAIQLHKDWGNWSAWVCSK